MQVATESMYYVSVLFGGSVEIVFLGMCLVCHGQAKPSVSASHVQTFCSAFCLSSPQTSFLLPGHQVKNLDSAESRAFSLLTFRCCQLFDKRPSRADEQILCSAASSVQTSVPGRRALNSEHSCRWTPSWCAKMLLAQTRSCVCVGHGKFCQ